MIAGLMLFAAGCGDDDDTQAPPAATLRVIHASANAPAVDIYANGGTTPIRSGVSYKSATNYSVLTPGEYTFELRQAGADPTPTTIAYTSPTFTVAANARITAVASGFFGAGSTAANAFRIQVYVENFGDAGAGVLTRIIHGSPDAGDVAIDVGNDATAIADAEVRNLTRFEATSEAGIALPSGQALGVGLWTESNGQKLTQFTTPPLAAGSNVFLIAAGEAAQPSTDASALSILAVGPTGFIGAIAQEP